MPVKYVKKTILLNSDYVTKAVKLLNAKTEKEAVNRALEMLVEDEMIINVHNEIGGSVHIQKIYR